jgi:SAM-dependent methyltransferase
VADHREALRRIAARGPLRAWSNDATDLPWGDAEFSERMLREHLNQSHELASRRLDTIERQTDRLLEWLGIGPGSSLLDVTCGPGLVARAFARRGISVTGVDIAPAAIRHAIEITAGLPCTFIECDVRKMPLPVAGFDAAIYLYGQGGVPRPEDQREILTRVRRALRHGAPLVLELRDAASVDRGSDTRWWAGTDDLFGSGAHLVLTERDWDPDARATVERDIVLGVETGALSIFGVTERAFEPAEIAAILAEAGFPQVEFHRGWDGLAFDDSSDWLVAIGR